MHLKRYIFTILCITISTSWSMEHTLTQCNKGKQRPQPHTLPEKEMTADRCTVCWGKLSNGTIKKCCVSYHRSCYDAIITNNLDEKCHQCRASLLGPVAKVMHKFEREVREGEILAEAIDCCIDCQMNFFSALYELLHSSSSPIVDNMEWGL